MKTYTCDRCRKLIDSGKNAGFLAWSKRIDENHQCHYRNFIIAHRTCLPTGCLDTEIAYFQGVDGISKLILMLERGEVEDIASWAEACKRIHIPHYEEARKYFQMADADGFHDGASPEAILTQQNLTDLIRKYAPKNDWDR